MADERYEWYKSHGICVDCGANEAYRGHTQCLECRFKGIEKTQKWQEKNREHHKEYQKAYQRNLRQYRRDNGLCQQCGKPSGNKAFCPPMQLYVGKEKKTKGVNLARSLVTSWVKVNTAISAEKKLRSKVIKRVQNAMSAKLSGRRK